MPSAYIAQLDRERATQTPLSPRQETDLRQRFLAWHAALPEVSRNRPFAMAELEAALGTQGKYLSPILLGLGWARKRKWSSRSQYPRYWVPPETC